MDRAGTDEADIQAPQPQAGQQARVSRPDEDARRAEGPESAPPARTRSARREGRRQVAGAALGGGQGLPRAARIGNTAEIRALLERGKRERTKHLDVFYAASPASRSRLGLIVPKHGRRIVERNLLKRRLREIGRREILPVLDDAGTGMDVLIRAKRSAYGVEYESLKRELTNAMEAVCSRGC